MAAVSTKMLNILEWGQRHHRGKYLPDIKMLAQENQVVMDIPWREANDGTTHLFRQQTALPQVYKTMFGEGTPESKSQTAEEREHCTMLSGFSTVPVQTARLHGTQGAVRAEEDANFAEAMKQGMAKAVWYDNRNASLKDIVGFATRYNTLSGVKAKNVLSCAGASANAQTSIYGVNWGRDVYGIFPEGMAAGYEKINRGVQVKTLSNGNQLSVYQTEHVWHFGIVVEAWQSAGRICNIEVADALALTNNQAPSSVNNILHKILLLKQRFRRPGKKVLYANDTIHALLMRIGMEKSSGAVTVQEATNQFGTFMELRVHGMPMRLSDQILNTEAVVS